LYFNKREILELAKRLNDILSKNLNFSLMDSPSLPIDVPVNLVTRLDISGVKDSQSQGPVFRGKGKIVFRPLEAKFLEDREIIRRMDLYCRFKIGFRSTKTSIADQDGVIPRWRDAVSIKVKDQEFAKLIIKDRNRLSFTDKVGKVRIPLDEVYNKGKVKKWYSLYTNKQNSGDILIELEYIPKESDSPTSV